MSQVRPKGERVGEIAAKAVAELKNRVLERDTARSAVKRTKFLLAAVKRSMGMLSAQNVAQVPSVGGGIPAGSVFEQFCAITDPVKKSAFFNQHRDELTKYINKPTPTSNASSRI